MRSSTSATTPRASQPFILMVSYGVPHFPHAHRAGGVQGPLSAGEDQAAAERSRGDARARRARRRRATTPTARRWTSASAMCWPRWRRRAWPTNTILVFTSDHGEMLGSHGCPPIMKQVPWDESAHVPFLLRYPAVHGRRGASSTRRSPRRTSSRRCSAWPAWRFPRPSKARTSPR